MKSAPEGLYPAKCQRDGTLLLLAGVHAQPLVALSKAGLTDTIGFENLLGNVDDALNRARELLGPPPQARPAATPAEVAREERLPPPAGASIPSSPSDSPPEAVRK